MLLKSIAKMSCLLKVVYYVKTELAMQYSLFIINAGFSICSDGLIHNFHNILSFLMKACGFFWFCFVFPAYILKLPEDISLCFLSSQGLLFY